MGKKDGHDNLIPVTKRTKGEAREISRKGGIASGVARREKKALREQLADALEAKTNGKTLKEVGMVELALKFADGDLKAIELAAKLLGEYSDRHELTGADGQPLALQAAPPKKLTDKEMRVALEELREDL